VTAGVTDLREEAPGFAELGIAAFTTTRHAGSFNLSSAEPVADVVGRWLALAAEVGGADGRLAFAHQVHGAEVLTHGGGWRGWLRAPEGDGHFSNVPGTAMAVTLADCVPVFIAHPSGAAAVLHSGWKGTAANITARGIASFVEEGHHARDLVVHAGPAICGRCYEVSPEVYVQVTGSSVSRRTPVDLRAVIERQAREAGVSRVTLSASCTRCDNDRFFSHRGGDSGRQLGVIAAR
jgi:YfiH family protein